ncbi:hypothetical protein, partial [Ralstonia pseudosolanacearum]|uniref:hypothetical protein n=1 Tax=Ralstonia pseudosolanacearum TaxID=1310165 RepID=UPI003D1821F2
SAAMRGMALSVSACTPKNGTNSASRPRVMLDPVDQRGAFGQCMRRHRSPQRFHGNRSEAALDGPPQRA